MNSIITDRSSELGQHFERQVSDTRLLADSLCSQNPQWFPFKRTEIAETYEQSNLRALEKNERLRKER